MKVKVGSNALESARPIEYHRAQPSGVGPRTHDAYVPILPFALEVSPGSSTNYYLSHYASVHTHLRVNRFWRGLCALLRCRNFKVVGELPAHGCLSARICQVYNEQITPNSIICYVVRTENGLQFQKFLQTSFSPLAAITRLLIASKTASEIDPGTVDVHVSRPNPLRNPPRSIDIT